jgi:hypothetical protein
MTRYEYESLSDAPNEQVMAWWAEARRDGSPADGSPADGIGMLLAGDLAAKVPGAISVPVIFALGRAAASLNALVVAGICPGDIVHVLGCAAAELERRAGDG